MTGGQDAVVAFLADEATHGGAPVERVDTHGAIVFLAGTRAYKLKRSVRFSYLDYSTPALRRAACEAELALNRRTAPALYDSALPVTREPDGRLALGGGGEPVDWVVAMRRFDRALEFDRLAADGLLTPALVEGLARAVARFHRARNPVAGFGGAAGIAAVLDENRTEFAREAAILDPVAAASADAACRRAFAPLAGMLDARAAAGHVRRCHGDLHLGNVVLFDGAPTPFDAIEFSDAIATVDTLFDLAFLLMDLELRASPALAGIARVAYLDEEPAEAAGLAALPLFLALRAAIRAHTLAAAARVQSDPARRDALAAEARRHLAAIAGFLAARGPVLVAIGGLSGSGKSTLARALAPELGAELLRTDALRKALAGVPETTRLGQEHYTQAASARVYGDLLARAETVLRAGHGVVLDAVFLRREERAAVAAVAARVGTGFVGFWLEAPREIAAARIAARTHDASDATPAVLDAQLARDAGAIDWIRIPAEGGAVAVLAAARAALGRSP